MLGNVWNRTMAKYTSYFILRFGNGSFWITKYKDFEFTRKIKLP